MTQFKTGDTVVRLAGGSTNFTVGGIYTVSKDEDLGFVKLANEEGNWLAKYFKLKEDTTMQTLDINTLKQQLQDSQVETEKYRAWWFEETGKVTKLEKTIVKMATAAVGSA